MQIEEKGQDACQDQDDARDDSRIVFEAVPVFVELFQTLIYDIYPKDHSGKCDGEIEKR